MTQNQGKLHDISQKLVSAGVDPNFLHDILMTFDALLHPLTALDAGDAMSARLEHETDRFRGAVEALVGRLYDFDADLLVDGRVAAEALLHPLTAIDAGDAMSARLEQDADGFRGAHHALARRRTLRCCRRFRFKVFQQKISDVGIDNFIQWRLLSTIFVLQVGSLL